MEMELNVFLDDVLVTVNWMIGLGGFIFGRPTTRVLSVKDGHVGCVSRTLNPISDLPLCSWVRTLRELSRTTVEFENYKDLMIQVPPPVRIVKICSDPIERWTPSSMLLSPVRKLSPPPTTPEKKKRRKDVEPKGIMDHQA